MTPPASSPNLPPDVQRQANEYHQAAAVERRRANHHQADLNRVVAAELEALAPEDLPGATDRSRHTVGYQDLGGDVLEIVVGGQPTLGTVSSIGETDWVAINRLGTVLGYHPSKATAAAAVGKEWDSRSRSVRLGRHAEAAMTPRS